MSTPRAVLAILMLGVLSSPGPAAPNDALDPCTTYLVLGKPPKGLSGFQAFGLHREESRANQLGGWIMTNLERPDESTIPIKKISLAGRQVRFATESRRGLVFRFDGRFLKGGAIRRFTNSRTAVVEGRVTRLMNGRKTNEGTIRFYCEDGAG